MIVITTSPCTCQSRYTPLANEEIVRVSSTVPVAASLIWICSTRAPGYSRPARTARGRVACPSVRFRLTVKLVAEYQAASIRPVPPGFWSAWGAVVVFVQSHDDWPLGVTVAYDGRLAGSPMTSLPCAHRSRSSSLRRRVRP